MSKILASNILNPFDVVHLLPLMENRKNAQTFEHAMGVHAIYVPSNLGGRLTVGFGRKHGAPDHALAVVDTEGTMHRSDAQGRVFIDIPPGKRGKTGLCLANVRAPTGRYSIYACSKNSVSPARQTGIP